MSIDLVESMWRSWMSDKGLSQFESIQSWILERNNHTAVKICRIDLDECSPWVYDDNVGRVKNPTGAFFQIAGCKSYSLDVYSGEKKLVLEQPILIQDEIGYLGIICHEFDGVMHFLMQAKIEPGNVNKVQISPTIQATRSNFLQLHGGRKPAYLDYFLEASRHKIIVDQIQSEQSARFLGKRNRNVILQVDEEVEVLPTHRWMTLGQIKGLMCYDNLVNMDSRTVLSCIPWSFWGKPDASVIDSMGDSFIPVLNSIYSGFDMDEFNEACRKLNDYKMFDTSERELVPLSNLSGWDILPDEICCHESYPFKVIFCDISIEGREVKRWAQPLFEAQGKAFFGLLSCVFEGKEKYLVALHPEIGCFDRVEWGPTVQREAGIAGEPNEIDSAFFRLIGNRDHIVADVVLSEEGGRFYHEQNRNVLLRLDRCPEELAPENLPDEYMWLDFSTLNLMSRANNVMNIQLRNLLSLIDFER